MYVDKRICIGDNHGTMLSQTTEYALRAVVWLASRNGAAQTTREIAAATRIPAGYLSKVLQTLSKAGLVESQRGLHGGFTLAVSPKDLSVLEVVNSVSPMRRFPHCTPESEMRGRFCALHVRLDETLVMLEQIFGDTRIGDLVMETCPGRQLCRLEARASHSVA